MDPEGNQRRAKYERYGGPTLRQVAQLLTRWAPDPEAELLALLDHVVFTLVIGNADAHGKNVGLLHPRVGEVRLAPLYDTVPTMMWPELRHEAAMAVGGEWDLQRIGLTDVVREARSWNLSQVLAERRVRDVLARLDAAVREANGPASLLQLVRARLAQLAMIRD